MNTPDTPEQTQEDLEQALPAQLRGLHNLQRGIGEVAMLLARHPAYQGRFLSDFRRTVVPAVLFNQHRVIRNRQNRTIGYVSWAKVSEKVHQRLMSGRLNLQLAEWRSGDMAVVLEIAAPAPVDIERILHELKTDLFKEEPLWIYRSAAGADEPKLAVYQPPGENTDD